MAKKRRKTHTHEGLIEGFRHWYERLESESDRGLALAAGAYLDAALESLLRRYFVDDDKKTDELLNETGPLGTFSSRTTLAYCLGLFGQDVRGELDLIRKIRNDFAHDHDLADFDQDAQIRDRCRSLQLYTSGLPPDIPRMLPTRDHFLHAASYLASWLLVIAAGTQRRGRAANIRIVWPKGL